MTPAQHQLQPLQVVMMPLQLLQLHPQVAILQANVLFALFANKPQLLASHGIHGGTIPQRNASHGIHVQSMQQVVAQSVQQLLVMVVIQSKCLSCESMDMSCAGGYDGYFKHSSAAAASAAASSGIPSIQVVLKMLCKACVNSLKDGLCFAMRVVPFCKRLPHPWGKCI